MTSGSGFGGRLLASFPVDVRAGAGIGVDKAGLATRVSIDLRKTQRLSTIPASGLVPVQDPLTGLVGALPVTALPTAQTGDGTQTNAKLATMPARTFKANLLNTTAPPQDVNFTQVLEALGITSGGSVATTAANVSVVPPASQGYTNVQGAITSIEGRINNGSGSVTSDKISDASASGRAVLTGTPAQGRTALGIADQLVRTFHVDDYGADASGAKNSGPAFLACWNACVAAGGGRISMENKGHAQYRIEAKLTTAFPDAACAISIIGGNQDACEVYFPNGGGWEIQYNNNKNAIHAKQFTVRTGAEGVGEGLCLKVIKYGVGGFSHIGFNLIEQVTVCGSLGVFNRKHWARGFSVRGPAYVNFFNCFAEGGSSSGEDSMPLGIGLAVAGAPLNGVDDPRTSYGVIYNIVGCALNCCDIGFYYDDFIQGVNIDNCNLGYNRVSFGTVSQANGNPLSELAQLYVTNTQVGANLGNVIEFLKPVFTAAFVNCTFFIRANCYGLYSPISVPTRFTSCTFAGDGYKQADGTATVPGTVGIYLGPSAVPGGSITGCDFSGLGNGILLNATGVSMDALGFERCPIPIQDNGNGNTYGAGFTGDVSSGNLPDAVIGARRGNVVGQGSRALQFTGIRDNGTEARAQFYCDKNGSTVATSTNKDGSFNSGSVFSILYTLANLPTTNFSGAITANGNATVSGATSLQTLNATATDINGNLIVRGGVGFYGTAPIGKQTITGNLSNNEDMLSRILNALQNLGLITNGTSF